MKKPFQIGDIKSLSFQVTEKDLAAFDSGVVHPVYATFALGRDAEWTCRQFVLEMKEDTEEGIGTFLDIKHHSPALLGEIVLIEATLQKINHHEIICSYTAKVKDRLLASGTQGQKIIQREKLISIFERLKTS